MKPRAISIILILCLVSGGCGRLNYENRDAGVDADCPQCDAGDATSDAGDGTSDASDTGTDPVVLGWTPSNIDPALISAGTSNLLIDGTDGTVIFDTGTGTFTRAAGGPALITGVVVTNVAQGNGLPELAVLSVTSVNIYPTITLRVVGTRGFVLAVSGDVQIDGILDASAGAAQGNGLAWTGGPGGYDGGHDALNATGPGAGITGSTGIGGSGAGGLHAGGNSFNQLGGPISIARTLTPLIGGSGGGRGAGQQAWGGGGGGAVQISARTAIRIGGIVRAHGRGGLTNGASGGGGGGGGGTVLLEAPSVTVSTDGLVCANGGGGGGIGSGGVSSNGASGQDSQLPANGGGVAPNIGGAGGAGTEPPTNATGGGTGQGAGGSAGRLRIRSTTPAVLSGVLSPSGSGLVVDSL
jgi:hypothetical protein